MLKKIVILGPESTGKSTLCEQLAEHYQTVWCPEYAREWLGNHGNKYNYDDLLTIAKGQLALEDEYSRKIALATPFTSPHSLLFIDTDMNVMKVWCEFVFDKCHRFILDQVVVRKYDGYLLCDTDLPWEKDDLREYPELASRRTLYNIYKDILVNQAVPWYPISGAAEERLQKAIIAVDSLLS